MHADGESYFNDLAANAKELRRLESKDPWDEQDPLVIEKLLLASLLFVRKLDDHGYLTKKAASYQVVLEGEGNRDLRWVCDKMIHSVHIGTSRRCLAEGIDFESDHDNGKRHVIAYQTIVDAIKRCSVSYHGTPHEVTL